MPERTLTVTIIGDDRDLKRAFASSEKAAGRFQGKIGGATAGIGKNFLAAGIAAGATAVSFQAVTRSIGASVTAASDLSEQVSKSREVFGESSEEVEKWSETTSRSFGISQRAALEATGTFGNLFNTVGLLPKQAAEMSRSLVELAADLASFNNADPSEVLQAIRSGLIGEAEPLRRYGVLLSEAKVQQLAMATTGKESAKALTDQEKALARYQIILRDTAPAQGDFARTSDSLANQSRVLNANLADLSATMGKVLVPAVNEVVVSLNHFIESMEAFAGQLGDFRGGVRDFAGDHLGFLELPEPPDWMRTFVFSDDARDLIFGRDSGGRVGGTPSPRGQERSTPEDLAIERAREREKKAREAQGILKRSAREFEEFTKGLGLKLDKAGLTQGLGDDIAVLRELERAILRQIEREGKTFQLVDRLTQVRLQISSRMRLQAQDAQNAAQDAFDATISALSLDLEVAQASKSLKDDVPALRALEQAILRQIEAEGKTTDLVRQLFQNRQQQAEVARQLADQKREQKQASIFKSLGLTDEGDEKTPGAGSLLRRARNLQDQIKGTTLDTNKNRQQLARIVSALTKNYKSAGREVRSAILAMLNDISSALSGDDPETKKGPLTKGSGLNTKKILEGLGLSADEINALRGRLSSINSAGLQLPPGASSVGSKTTSGRPFDSGLTIDNYVTVEIDGVKVTSTVTKQQQKQRRRNPRQKRGPNRMQGGV